jgi:hypothetical protein
MEQQAADELKSLEAKLQEEKGKEKLVKSL